MEDVGGEEPGRKRVAATKSWADWKTQQRKDDASMKKKTRRFGRQNAAAPFSRLSRKENK
jgi:hypothetical protein